MNMRWNRKDRTEIWQRLCELKTGGPSDTCSRGRTETKQIEEGTGTGDVETKSMKPQTRPRAAEIETGG
jgi:hypothetical protein